MHDELTANDIKKMEDEIEYRKLVVRKKALDDVKVARAQGDLSENFEYKAAKQFKNQNESRIRYLEKMIKTAVVISDESKDDEVGMFNTVDVYFEDDDETETYKIVTTVRGNSLKNLISKESPLGAAIFGHKVGDRCHGHRTHRRARLPRSRALRMGGGVLGRRRPASVAAIRIDGANPPHERRIPNPPAVRVDVSARGRTPLRQGTFGPESCISDFFCNFVRYRSIT